MGCATLIVEREPTANGKMLLDGYNPLGDCPDEGPEAWVDGVLDLACLS
jgi:hypothetical protein